MLYPFLFFFFALRSHSHWGHNGSALSVFDDSEKFCERFAWLNALFEYMTHKGHNDCPWRLTKITWMPSELEEFRRVFWEEKNLNLLELLLSQSNIHGLEPRRPAHLNEFNFHFPQHLWSLLFYFENWGMSSQKAVCYFLKINKNYERSLLQENGNKFCPSFVERLLPLIILPIIIVWI